MVLLLTADDIAPLIDMGEAVDALDQAFARWSDPAVQNLARRRMPAGQGASRSSAMNVLAGALPGGDIFGLRTTVYGMDANTLVLYSAAQGKAIALMACGAISATRTGAASGVATKYLARADATRIGIVGSGRTARQQLAAIAKVRKLARVTAYSRDAAKCRDFAADMSKRLSLDVVPAESAEDCTAASIWLLPMPRKLVSIAIAPRPVRANRANASSSARAPWTGASSTTPPTARPT